MEVQHDEQKEFILECLETPGFREVFMWEVSSNRPLIWDGYKIAKFFNHGQKDFDEIPFLTDRLKQLAGTYRFPKNPIHEAALYFFLQRSCVKEGWMWCWPESPRDKDSTCLGHWSLFYLMYLDSLTWRFPDVFKLDPFEKNKEVAPREKYIFGEVCRQLCGVRTSSAKVFHDRTGSETEYRNICSHCAKKHWAERFHKAAKHPALVLALSFYANGFASFKTESNQKRDAEKLNADYLFDLVDRATNYRFFVPEEDWEARAVFFILAQWLFLSDRRDSQPSLEEHIFAILYLRFYRQGVDDYFKRESMSAIWDGIPYEKKEDVAVYYRRLLADTRNKAAEAWPDAKVSDYPEVDNSAVFGEVFRDLVRAKDYKRLDLLLQEDVVYAPYRNVELLWAASHSKRMFNRLLKVKTIPENEPPCITKWEDVLEAEVIGGWRTLGADPNHPTSGCNYYPAAWAIYAKRADILEMLIDAGARPFPQNNYCWYNLNEEATAFWEKQSPKVRQFVEAGMTKGRN